ncbi:MAG: hypothetical protein ACJ74J_05980 [Blastocatellia bacterium]
MKVCNEIQRRIDEADDIESYNLDVARHTEACDACRRFARERAALREIIRSTARVNAPINFDAMLHARLAEVKGRKGLAWLNAAFYLRAGAATAALAVTVFVAQHMGLFAPTVTEPTGAETTAETIKPTEKGQPATAQDSKVPAVPGGSAVTAGNTPRHIVVISASTNMVSRSRAMTAGVRRGAGVPLMAPVDAAFVDSGAILIPGRNGQRDVAVPTVSVGAQPLIYGNAGRQPQAARPVTVSF